MTIPTIPAARSSKIIWSSNIPISELLIQSIDNYSLASSEKAITNKLKNTMNTKQII